MKSTRSGNVRRNELSDFESIRQNGKLAMRLENGDMLAGVEICNEGQDVLLTTAQGQCIRFAITDVRVFKGRDSTGVRGIRLAEGDAVISMTILRHVDASAEDAMIARFDFRVADEEEIGAGGRCAHAGGTPISGSAR